VYRRAAQYRQGYAPFVNRYFFTHASLNSVFNLFRRQCVGPVSRSLAGIMNSAATAVPPRGSTERWRAWSLAMNRGPRQPISQGSNLMPLSGWHKCFRFGYMLKMPCGYAIDPVGRSRTASGT
jgi:hypothetical protein